MSRENPNLAACFSLEESLSSLRDSSASSGKDTIATNLAGDSVSGKIGWYVDLQIFFDGIFNKLDTNS